MPTELDVEVTALVTHFLALAMFNIARVCDERTLRIWDVVN